MRFLEHLKIDRPLAVFDLETTGIDKAEDRIVEIAIMRIEPDGGYDLFHTRVNPGMPIPEQATAVHGIGDEDVENCPPFGDIVDEVARLLRGCDLAGFGITSFDLPILVAEFARTGRNFRVAGRRVFDSLDIYRRMEPRDLTSAVAFYLGRGHDDAHSAIGDVLATASVLDAQVAHYGLPDTPGELHREFIEVDVARRFVRDAAGEVVFNFGKYRGRRLAEVVREDRGYLSWMQEQSFLDDVRALLLDAIGEADTQQRVR